MKDPSVLADFWANLRASARGRSRKLAPLKAKRGPRARMAAAYIEAAYFTDPELMEMMDESIVTQMYAESNAFFDAHQQAIEQGPFRDPYRQAGHDLWMTRNGHGAGFWDGDWPEPAATELTRAARALGEFSGERFCGHDDCAEHPELARACRASARRAWWRRRA